MKKPTIKDVAALAGVSVGTVSMTLNGSDKISQSTKDQVMLAVKKLGYKRDPYARSLSTSSSSNMGLIVPDLKNPFYGELCGTMQEECMKRNFCMMLGLATDDMEKEKKLVDTFMSHGSDGIIIVPESIDGADVSHLHALINENFPLVFISHYYPTLPLHTVMTDLRRGTRMMTEYLISRGHRDILIVAGSGDPMTAQLRILGYKDAMTAKGFSEEEQQILTIDKKSYSGTYEDVLRWYEAKHPTAIMTVNDVMAMGVISALKKKGVKVPDEVSVTGYDDITISSLQETPVTTIRQRMDTMCEKALDMLIRMKKGEDVESEPVLIEPELVIRDSTN